MLSLKDLKAHLCTVIVPLPLPWPVAKLALKSPPLQVLKDGTLLLSRRAAVLEQLGLTRQEGHEDPVAPAPAFPAEDPQIEIGSILRYLSFMSCIP